MKGLVIALLAAAVAVTACGGGQGSAVATNPGGDVTGGAIPQTASASPAAQTSGVRTVLAPLGLRVHGSASLSAPVLGAAAQGSQLTVLGYTGSNGGWYHVQGLTTTGWITADPTLSAPGSLQSYPQDNRDFGALYPQGWTFAEEPNYVVFQPQAGGGESILAAVIPPGQAPPQPTGYTQQSNSQVVVCGATGTLTSSTAPTGPSPTPGAFSIQAEPYLQVLQVQLDPTHSMTLVFNYRHQSQAIDFANFYNSVRFPFPECEAQPASSASASAAASPTP